jgi:hypothetical protein
LDPARLATGLLGTAALIGAAALAAFAAFRRREL